MADIITLANYKAYDDQPSPMDSGTEAQIEAAIDLATSYIEQSCGRVFDIADSPSPLEAVEILNGNGTSRLYTRNSPVQAVTTLEYWDGDSWAEYDSTTYPHSFKAGSNCIYFTQGHKFVKGFQNIRATFEYGYTTALPNDLKYACFLVAKHIVLEAERQGIQNQTDGEQTFNYEHSIPKVARAIIARYKTVY